jgi:hypothetical protein
MKPRAPGPGASSGAGEPPRTKNQIKATAMADGLAAKVRWKTLTTEAKATWEKLYPEDLARVDGNFHKLAGLVQLRYHISREESDRQVKDFFDKHYSIA